MKYSGKRNDKDISVNKNEGFLALKKELEDIFGKIPDELVYPLDIFRKSFPEFLRFYRGLIFTNLFDAINLFIEQLMKSDTPKSFLIKKQMTEKPTELGLFLATIISIYLLKPKLQNSHKP